MGKFVEEDLENVTILKCKEVEKNDIHKHYKIIVKDENNNRYMWRDTITECGCDEATLIANIKTHVLTLEKKELLVLPNIVNNNRGDVIGSTLA